MRCADRVADGRPHHRTVNRRHTRAATIADVDDLQCSQRVKCFSHHGSADAELAREIAFAGQIVAYLQAMFAYVVADSGGGRSNKATFFGAYERIVHAAIP